MKILYLNMKHPVKGFVYETISIICLVSKELIENYNKISDTKLTEKDLVFIILLVLENYLIHRLMMAIINLI